MFLPSVTDPARERLLERRRGQAVVHAEGDAPAALGPHERRVGAADLPEPLRGDVDPDLSPDVVRAEAEGVDLI
jgi:hypothetical protein